MAKAPSFSFYAQDFLMGVMHMDMTDRGRYITLLAYQWDKGNIPKKRVGILLGFEWVSASEQLREKFQEKDDYIFNERLEKEREKRQKFIEKQRANGAKGGRPRKGKTQKKPKRNPTLNSGLTQKKPLEDEIEKENRKNKRGSGGKTKTAKIEYPFSSEKFMQAWEDWLDYKRDELGFKFKTNKSKQAALNKLKRDSENDESTAMIMIERSIANGWKGLFPLSNELKVVKNGRTSVGKEPKKGRSVGSF